MVSALPRPCKFPICVHQAASTGRLHADIGAPACRLHQRDACLVAVTGSSCNDSDPTGCDHERLGPGLRKAIYNYMHGLGLDEDVRAWFPSSKRAPKIPATTVPK